MKTLTLLRHAHAVQPGFVLNDFDRPLDSTGRQAAQRLGRVLIDQNITPDAVLCSASVRTEETYTILKDYLPAQVQATLDHQLYNANLETLVQRIKQLPNNLKNIFVIGHNPGLELFAGWLLPNSMDAIVRKIRTYYPPAAMLTMMIPTQDWSTLTPQSAEVKTFFDPSQI